MFKIDGKELDLTNLQSLAGLKITIKEGGCIEQVKDGQVVLVTKEQLDVVKQEVNQLKGN